MAWFFSYCPINETFIGKIYGPKEDIKIMKGNDNYTFRQL